MVGSTFKDKKVLLESARKIHTYKLMQAKGYERLTNKATDERIKHLLADISANELATLWREKAGSIADVESVSYQSSVFTAGNPIEVHLSADDQGTLIAAA